MPKTANRRWLCAFLFCCVAAFSALAQDAPSLPAAATEFVQLIQSRAGSPSAVAVTFQNLSSLSPERVEGLQNAIFNAFRNANVRVVKPEQAVAEVHITFSEDWQSYLLIAKHSAGIEQPDRDQETTASAAGAGRACHYAYHPQDICVAAGNAHSGFLSGQPEPAGAGAEPAFAVFNGLRTMASAANLGNPAPEPVAARSARTAGGSRRRDQRLSSRTRVAAEKFRLHRSIAAPVTIPGRLAKGWLRSLVREGISSVACWQAPSAGASVAPFFSGATWQNGDQHVWLFTGTDGHTRLFQNDLGTPISNVQRLGKHAGSGALSLRFGMAGADQFASRHHAPGQRTGR